MGATQSAIDADAKEKLEPARTRGPALHFDGASPSIGKGKRSRA